MKHTLAFLAFLLSFLNNTPAQTPFSALPVTRIELPVHPQPEPSSQLIYNHIEVLDQRPDTARIGIHTSESLLAAKTGQLAFISPAAAALSDWFNLHYTRPDAAYSALIVFRTLWLSDANFIREDIVKQPELNNAQTCLRVKAEVYAGRDGQYLPLFRMDTLLINLYPGSGYQIKAPYGDWKKQLTDLLIEMIERSAATIAWKEVNSSPISRMKIDSFNHTRFNYPVDTVTALAPGVYASFNEFRNNAPSIRSYQIQMDGKDQLLYLQDAAGKYYYSHESWGYSDGKTIFVMRNGKLCPAWRERQALYFFDTSEKLVTPFIRTQGPYNSKRTKKTKHIIYTVDMDKGGSY